MARKRYPIGIQTFSEIRKGDYLYIDKTEYVYRMTHADAKYMFLSRPRRFGKSLLVSTLHAYFEGRKELFEGLAIANLEIEWEQYPVLHFDMSMGKHMDKDALNRYLHNMLQNNELRLGIKTRDVEDTNVRFTNLIMDIYHQTGKQVVVLIDEYDAPLLDVVHEEKDLPVLRNVMRNFYSPLKACDPYLRYVFLTGITKFSQLSIFSELNNIKNISMEREYADICGITEEEIKRHMKEGMDELADKLQVTHDEVLDALKENYDGYHFTWPSPDVYNPYSLLNAFSDGRLNSYWFGSGTPTYLIEMLRKYNVLPSEIGGIEAMAADFDAPTEQMESIVPLLYQSGYITIKNGDPQMEIYLLDIPNKEVRVGLMRSLLPNYVNRQVRTCNVTVAKMSLAISEGRMDDALRLLQTFLGTVPYCDNTDYEGHYQQLMYIIFSMLSYEVDVEVRTPHGRVDMVLKTRSKLYLIELKLDRSADKAMEQINLKNYSDRFALCKLPVVKVGINFDSKKGTIDSWKIETV
ncbi:AAA family ATPase [Bacteroidales bacterium SW299]|nr:AAA family ATPase [Bacteroidales bacterium SW299]